MCCLTLDDLEMHGIKYGFEPLAISNDEKDQNVIEKIR